jgi:hypothetical protein
MSDTLSNAHVAAQIHQALAPLGVVSIDDELEHEPLVGRMRRYRKGGVEDPVGVLTLLDVDGVLVWEDGAVTVASSMRRRRGGGGRFSADGTVVTQVKYSKELGRNSIGERLRQLDATLTPMARRDPDVASGARLIEYDAAHDWAATPDVTAAKTGRILLFVHGTFSSTQKIVDDLHATVEGRALLADVEAAGYTQILGFDHYTLSRSPYVNAVQLARLFADSAAEIDIICHSRGGLVVRWFCEVLDRRPDRQRRVVFVGCPLRGTSLADPQSLRHGLNLMTNVGKMLGEAGSLVPFLAAASGLVQIFSSVGGLVANSPAIDAGIGLVPGLSAMSRIQHNAELDSLNYGERQPRGDYFAVASSFRTEDVGWRFWRMFNKLKGADWAADYLVFEQDNDLVVDTESMTHHAFGPAPDLENATVFCRFDGDSRVHHTTYFRDARTLDFLRRSFAL